MKARPSRLKLLSEDMIEQIFNQALTILAEREFRVLSPQVRGFLDRAGACVEEARESVTLPPEVVRESLSNTPSELILHTLDGEPLTLCAGSVQSAVGSYVEAIQWLDYDSSDVRPSKLADLERAVRLADALPLVSLTGIVVWPMDVPPQDQLRQALRALLTSTRKSLTFGVQSVEQARTIAGALSIASSGGDLRKSPPALFVCSPTSPLVLDRDSGDAAVFLLSEGLPPILAPCPMAGGTSPFSVIGTVLQQVVENLFMITVKEAVSPGSPVLWGGAGAALDMRTGDVSYGGIERSLMMLANIDMADFLGLPCHSPAASIDSNRLDLQAGVEKTWTYMSRALSGAAAGLGVGAVGNGKAVSAEQMIIDADILQSIRRFTDGIDMDRLAQSADEIMRISPGDNFLTADLTLELLHEGQEYCYPRSFNRSGETWSECRRRAHDYAETLLDGWETPVRPVTLSELHRFLGEG